MKEILKKLNSLTTQAAINISKGVDNYSEDEIAAARLAVRDIRDRASQTFSILDNKYKAIAASKQLALDEIFKFEDDKGRASSFGVRKVSSYSVIEGQLRRDAGAVATVNFADANLSKFFENKTVLKRNNLITAYKNGDADASKYVSESIAEQLYFSDEMLTTEKKGGEE